MRVIRHPEVPRELEAAALWYVAGSEQSFSTNQDWVGGLTIPAELIG